MIWNPSFSAEDQRETGLYFVSRLKFCDLPGIPSIFQVTSSHCMMDRVDNNSWEHVWKEFVCSCVGTKENGNLSGPQKELLTCHCKLGVGMQQIQEMMWRARPLMMTGKD